MTNRPAACHPMPNPLRRCESPDPATFAAFSAEGMPNPPRLVCKLPAPVVLLHATLLPVNHPDPADPLTDPAVPRATCCNEFHIRRKPDRGAAHEYHSQPLRHLADCVSAS